MPAPKNLVHETTTGTGTSDLTLARVFGRQRFSEAFSTGGSNTFYYFISHRTAYEWEVGTGSLSDATTLVRDTVLASSNSDSAVNFSAGTKDVTNDIPASLQVGEDLAQTLTNKTLDFAKLLDTSGDHHLRITCNENLTDNRDLNFIVGDSTWTVTVAGDLTIADWFDQSVKTTASPTFADVFLPSGGVINFNSGDVTVTHSSDELKFSGANIVIEGRLDIEAQLAQIRLERSDNSAASRSDITNVPFGTISASNVQWNYGLKGTSNAWSLVTWSGAVTGHVFYAQNNGDISIGKQSGSGKLDVDGTIRAKGYTVATLPTVGTAGRRAYVTDANATTFASTVAGGGSNVVPVFDNGTNWIIA